MTRFAFVDHSSEKASALDALTRRRYVVDDRRLCALFGSSLATLSADLITIALSCYTADRLERRGVRWWRDLSIRIPVVDPAYWSVRKTEIEDFLHRLTDDTWTLEFVGGRKPRSAEQQLPLLPIGVDPNSVLALFSGGLDSLAGAARHLAESPESLVLISARSSFIIGRDQRVLAEELRHLWPGRVSLVRIPVGLRDAGDGESTQRTRPFLHFTLAAVAAVTARLRSFSVLENGVGAYNPRVAEYQWGSQANQSTHPLTLDAFSRLMKRLDHSIDVRLPHGLETKAELVARMPRAARALIARTSSCDSYPLRKAGVTHCGTMCASCILRRQSLLAAKLERFDRTDYEAVPFGAASTTDAFWLAARQAWQFTKLDRSDEERLQQLWPSLAAVSPAERPAVIDVFKRYGREWQSIVEHRPAVALDCGWPLKQVA